MCPAPRIPLCSSRITTHIDEFADSAGFMDRTDPYVALSLGSEKQKTSCKNNVGGSVVFDETLSFDKQLFQSMLNVKVYDADTLSDDCLGEHNINLNLEDLQVNEERETPMPFEMVHEGKTAGKVYLMFSRKTPAGAFAGALHITVHSIDEFSDSAGFMDKTDPFVRLELGSEKLMTSCKNNAGGHKVIFNETLSFKKQMMQHHLKVTVLDSDTLNDDTLGENVIDLNAQDLQDDEGTVCV